MFTSSKDNKLSAAKDGIANEGGASDGVSPERTLHFKADARDAASAVKEDLAGVAHRTGQHARELADSAGHSLSGIGDVMSVRIRENPVQSSLIALGAGLVIGMLYKR